MNILYVSQYFPPETGAPAARVSELSRHWAGQDHRVTVLTGFPNHPTGNLAPEYREKLRRLVYREQDGAVDVVRTWLLPLPNRKPLQRVLSYTSFWLSSTVTGSLLSRPDVVIATSPQLLVGLTGWWLGSLKDIPFVLEIRDLWPESITASGVGQPDGAMTSVLRAISGFLYRRSDHIVVVTPAFKDDLVTTWGVPAGKVSVVENGVETDMFTPEGPGHPAVKRHEFEARFILSYVGTHGLAHGLDSVLEAAALLQASHPDILFLFVGEGADRQRLIDIARDRQLGNISFLPGQPRAEIPSLIRASDACLVVLKDAAVFRTVIPTKMLEFMACARPVILGVDGQARKVLETAGAGIPVPPEDPQGLAEAAVRLHPSDDERRTLGENGRRYVVNQLSRAATASVYTEVLNQVVSAQPNRPGVEGER